MLIGQHILRDKAIPYLSGLPCDALYFVIDSAAMGAIPKEFEAFIHSHHKLLLDIESEYKSTSHLGEIWSWLHQERASRRSLVVIIGGGTLTDLVGFAAATYMRGIPTVNIPTTLLGMVDASVGGKTGIDFDGIKNLIGAFHEPQAVFVDTAFLSTLPIDELFSGYGEVIKTALLSGEVLWHEVLQLGDPQGFDHKIWQKLISQCMEYKSLIVSQDPEERTGTRAALNLGHTTAHALEAYSRTANPSRPLKHGEAVAIGLLVEGYLAHKALGLKQSILRELYHLIRELYPAYSYTCKAYPTLLRLMQSDKKNSSGSISFTLLQDLGKPIVWQSTSNQEIEEALDFYREAFGK